MSNNLLIFHEIVVT